MIVLFSVTLAVRKTEQPETSFLINHFIEEIKILTLILAQIAKKEREITEKMITN